MGFWTEEQSVARVARWILAPVAAVLAWIVVFLVGAWTHGFAEALWCRGEGLEPGSNCFLPEWINHVLYFFFAGVAAVATLTTACAVAPRKSPDVVWVYYFVGVVIAAVMGMISLGAFVSAVFAGGVTAVVLTRRMARRRA